ncbi:MAG: UvrB/UvrC motif-containing protein [Candidatus Spechtbacterales bacterium]|nr:UvrB/UvrC motif-containing protein [Candidatus Spechtbacterales bacterium]
MRKSLSLNKIKDLPKSPGIYFLKNKQGVIFYVGKSTNIKSRVRTHANDDSLFKPEVINSVEYIKTANEIEALLKESHYIKKLQPKMNIRLRDDKQYFYAGVTKEEFPRIFITHQPTKNKKIEYIGPYTDGKALKETVKYLRRLFPYYTTNHKRPLRAQKHKALPCSWCHLGLCPGPSPDKKEYRKNIRAIKNVLKGRKSSVINQLKRDMKNASKGKDFEKAAEFRDMIDAIENIFSHQFVLNSWSPPKQKLPIEDVAKYLSKITGTKKPIYTIEGYDVSNTQGKEPTASMVRFDKGTPNKSLYRKFNIHSKEEPDDYLMMREVIKRRFKHDEWPYPDLILIDGGRGQLNTVIAELESMKLKIPTISLSKAKTEARKQGKTLSMREEEVYIPSKKKPIPLSEMPKHVENLLKYIRDEAHRFAINQHRYRRRKKFQ